MSLLTLVSFTTYQVYAQTIDSTKTIKEPVFMDHLPIMSTATVDSLSRISLVDTLAVIDEIDSIEVLSQIVELDTSLVVTEIQEKKIKPIINVEPKIESVTNTSGIRELLFVVNVRDSITQQPLRAKVYLTNLNNEGTRYDGTGICDQDGKFSLKMTSKSHFLISLMFEDYLMLTEEIDLSTVPMEDKAFAKTFELRQLKKGDLIDIKNIHFAPGKYYLEKESHPSLNRLVEMMRDNPKLVICINGHTDNTGNEVANLKLSQERVFAVRYYLIQKGISASRVKSKAFGGSKPIASNREEETRKLNRRVEFEVLKH